MKADNDDRITAPDQVARLLKRLIAARSLISIRLDGTTGDAASALLAVDQNSGHLSLDAFADPDQHRLVKPGNKLHAMTRIDDIVVRFECTIERIETAEDGPAYQTRLPGWIEYRERRSHLRVATCHQHHAYAILRIDGAGYRTELVNICLNGVGLAAPESLLNAVDTGDEIESSTITLANGPKLQCALEIKHLTPMSGRRIHVLGATLVNLPPGPRQQLQEYLFDLQRAAMQRNHEQT